MKLPMHAVTTRCILPLTGWITALAALLTAIAPAVAQGPGTPYNPAQQQQQPTRSVYEQYPPQNQQQYPPRNPAGPSPQLGPAQGSPPGSTYGPVQGPAPAAPQGPRQPVAPQQPFVLNAAQQNYLNRVLDYWEFRSSKIMTFSCKFTRWEYDKAWVASGEALTQAQGVVKYNKPDKGLFRVVDIRHYTAPKEPGQSASYEANPGEYGEHWVCDGRSIFEFNGLKKQLIERRLPPEMQGQQIVNGPLPFIFGANAKELRERYWMRVITPPTAKDQYWLEAYPKRSEDAANYHKVELILDAKEYLPVALQIYTPGGNERTVFQFSDRKVNETFTLDRLNLFKKEFYEPTTPRGWQKVVESYPQATMAGR